MLEWWGHLAVDSGMFGCSQMTFVLHSNILSCRLWHWTLLIPVTSKILLLHVVSDLAFLSIALIFIFLTLVVLEAAIRVLSAWSLSCCSHLTCGFRAGSLVLCLGILIEYSRLNFFEPLRVRIYSLRISCSSMCTREKDRDTREKDRDRRCHCHSLLHHVHAWKR